MLLIHVRDQAGTHEKETPGCFQREKLEREQNLTSSISSLITMMHEFLRDPDRSFLNYPFNFADQDD